MEDVNVNEILINFKHFVIKIKLRPFTCTCTMYTFFLNQAAHKYFLNMEQFYKYYNIFNKNNQ